MKPLLDCVGRRAPHASSDLSIASETLSTGPAWSLPDSRRATALIFVLLIAFVAIGCGSPKPEASNNGKAKAEKKDEPDPLSGRVVNLGEGSGTYRDDKPGAKGQRDPLWDVRWETSQVEAQEGGKAVLRTVHGRLYTNGKPTTTFEADGARIDQKAKLLILRGNVKIVTESSQPAGDGEMTLRGRSTLTCDLLRYEAKNPKRRVVKAQGNVRLAGEVGTVGPTAELWASPDLGVVATPNLFDVR